MPEEKPLKKYRCTVCGYVYDPTLGDLEGRIPPGTPFENLPDDWVCPVCGASKDLFEPV
ncbi:MAG: rubredoxin [Candidatus Brockarchaeota archaeon]|nr:rubredoxin [Candidatus Brockarchaeota archaeon]